MHIILKDVGRKTLLSLEFTTRLIQRPHMLTYLWQAPAPLHLQSFSAGGAKLGCHLHSSQPSCCHPSLCHKQGSSELHKSSSGPQGPCCLAGPPGIWFHQVDTPMNRVNESHHTSLSGMKSRTLSIFFQFTYCREKQSCIYSCDKRIYTQGMYSYEIQITWESNAYLWPQKKT